MQAENAYITAQSYANQGQWQDAITQLQTIPNLLAQAEAKEETYLRQQSQFQTQIFLLGGLGIGVVVVVFFLIKRSRKNNAVPNQQQPL